jgi:hypothetical protein
VIVIVIVVVTITIVTIAICAFPSTTASPAPMLCPHIDPSWSHHHPLLATASSNDPSWVKNHGGKNRHGVQKSAHKTRCELFGFARFPFAEVAQQDSLKPRAHTGGCPLRHASPSKPAGPFLSLSHSAVRCHSGSPSAARFLHLPGNEFLIDCHSNTVTATVALLVVVVVGGGIDAMAFWLRWNPVSTKHFLSECSKGTGVVATHSVQVHHRLQSLFSLAG